MQIPIAPRTRWLYVGPGPEEEKHEVHVVLDVNKSKGVITTWSEPKKGAQHGHSWLGHVRDFKTMFAPIINPNHQP